MGPYIENAADEMSRLNTQIKNQQVELGKKLLPWWFTFLKVTSTALPFSG